MLSYVLRESTPLADNFIFPDSIGYGSAFGGSVVFCLWFLFPRISAQALSLRKEMGRDRPLREPLLLSFIRQVSSYSCPPDNWSRLH